MKWTEIRHGQDTHSAVMTGGYDEVRTISPDGVKGIAPAFPEAWWTEAKAE